MIEPQRYLEAVISLSVPHILCFCSSFRLKNKNLNPDETTDRISLWLIFRLVLSKFRGLHITYKRGLGLDD
jgi:hypothetical protein